MDLNLKAVARAVSLAILLAGGRIGGLSAQDSTYRAGGPELTGPQLITVYVGATTCKPCRWPSFKEAMQKALYLVSQEAARRNMRYATVGVALDANKAKGLALLEPHDQFDELLVGGGWIGTGATQYIWSDTTVTGAIPMLLVVERDLDQRKDYRWMGLGNQKVLLRLTGANEIMAWVKQGAPLSPSLEPQPLPAGTEGRGQ